MKLRPGVKFHDGEKFDAAAVKFNIERHLNLPGSNRKAEISAVKAVEIVDDLTVKLVLDKPFAPLLAQLTDRAGMMVSPKAAQAAGDNFGKNPVCSGPYKFAERVAQDRIVLDRFADYWNKDAVHFDRVVFLPIIDTTVRLANLQSGGLDLIERVAATDLDAVRKDRGSGCRRLPASPIPASTPTSTTASGAEKPAGTRSARAPGASNCRSTARRQPGGVQRRIRAPAISGSRRAAPGTSKDMPAPKRDLARAKALLDEAKAPKLTVNMMVPNGTELMRAAQVIQAMAGEAGFDIKIEGHRIRPLSRHRHQGRFRKLPDRMERPHRPGRQHL